MSGCMHEFLSKQSNPHHNMNLVEWMLSVHLLAPLKDWFLYLSLSYAVSFKKRKILPRWERDNLHTCIPLTDIDTTKSQKSTIITPKTPFLNNAQSILFITNNRIPKDVPYREWNPLQRAAFDSIFHNTHSLVPRVCPFLSGSTYKFQSRIPSPIFVLNHELNLRSRTIPKVCKIVIGM